MSKKRCKNCNARIIEYPVYEGQEQDIPLMKGDTVAEKFKSLFTRETRARIKWYNLIIADWTKLLILATLIFVAWSYQHDTAACFAITENPCEFIDKNQYACLNWNRTVLDNVFIDSDTLVFELFNLIMKKRLDFLFCHFFLYSFIRNT